MGVIRKMALTPEEKELLRGWKPGQDLAPEVRAILAKLKSQEEAEEVFGEHAFVSRHNLGLGGKGRWPERGKQYENERERILQLAANPAYGITRDLAADTIREWEGLIYPPCLSRLQITRRLTSRWMDYYITRGQRPLPKGFPTWEEVLPRLVRSHPLLYRMLGVMRAGLEDDEAHDLKPFSPLNQMRRRIYDAFPMYLTWTNRAPRGAWTQEFMRFLYTCGTIWEAQVMARKAEIWMARTGETSFSYTDFPAEPWDLQAVANLALRLLWGGPDDWTSTRQVTADYGFWERVCHRTALHSDKYGYATTGFFDVSFPLIVFFAHDLERMNQEPKIPILGRPWNVISNAITEPLMLIYARWRTDPVDGWAETMAIEDLLASRTLGRLFRTDLLSLPPLEVVWDENEWPLPLDPRNEPEWQVQYWKESLAALPVKER